MRGSGSHPRCGAKVAGFTLTEVVVVIGILGLIVLTRLPALCRTRTPVRQLECLSNCRQIGAATLLYRSDHSDTYPYGTRVCYGWQVTDPNGWPMQLLRYMGGYRNVQPKVYVCPCETNIASGWVFQLHYQANRYLVSDLDDRDTPVRGAQVRNPAIYWMFMEKGPWDFANVRPGGLANPALASWNVPPGSPQYRRHSGGLVATAADGHVEWLRMPPYQPGRAAPASFWELGFYPSPNPDPWQDDMPPIKVKLYSGIRSGTGFQ
jgi:prepilin-type processing-associated H-X9-DG protein